MPWRSEVPRIAAMAIRASGELRRVTSTATLVGVDEMRFPPLKIAAVLAVGRDAGLAAADVLAGTRLSARAVAEAETRTSIAQYLRAAANLIRLDSRGGAGLRVGQRLHLSSYGMYGYALLCSETLRHAFDTAVRYHDLATPVMNIAWAERDDKAVWIFPRHDEIDAITEDVTLARFALEVQFTVHVIAAQDIIGNGWLPARARFSLPQPPYAEEMARVFGCPVEFDQPVNELHCALSWLDQVPRLANPITAVQASKTLAQLLQDLKWQSGLTRRVYQELTRTPGRFPDMEAIAATLCTTSRNLRRKLQAEGTSYQELLANVRYALARDYLNSSFLSTEDIAAALGFSDAASFRHAFKRWSGVTPAEFRG